MIKLDILSDPICPWCYIGKTYLFRALSTRPDHPFTMEWHPFQLNPDMPPEGMDRRAYLEGKFGGPEGAKQAYDPIAVAAQEAGLEVDLDGIQRTPNTIDAHRLIHWAGLEKKQTSVVQGLFTAYFEKAQDIGDHGVLLDIAEAAEMDREMVRRLLATDADADDIRKRDDHARSRGVSGVPTFILANQIVLPGAQGFETWNRVINDLLKQLAARDAQA